MSVAEIERFAADLKSNEALCAQAEDAQVGNSHATPIDRVVAFATSKGYAFTTEEAKEHAKAMAKAAGKEITDAELGGVAGGNGSYSLQFLDPAGGRFSAGIQLVSSKFSTDL